MFCVQHFKLIIVIVITLFKLRDYGRHALLYNDISNRLIQSIKRCKKKTINKKIYIYKHKYNCSEFMEM